MIVGTINAHHGNIKAEHAWTGQLVHAFGGNNQAGPIDVATARNAHAVPHGRLDFETETFVVQTATALRARDMAKGVDSDCTDTLIPYRVTGNDGAYQTGDAVGALRTMTDPAAQVVAYGISSDAVDRSGEGDGSAGQRAGLGIVEDASPSLRARATNSVASRAGVRRLLPVETERLQGFPDGWTDIVHRGKPAADGNRYKAIGNSMAVPVLGWLLDRVRADAPRPRTAA